MKRLFLYSDLKYKLYILPYVVNHYIMIHVDYNAQISRGRLVVEVRTDFLVIVLLSSGITTT